MVDSSNPDQGIKTKSPDDRIYSELAFVGFLMGGDLAGLGDGPPNLRWGTAHAFVPPIFGKHVTQTTVYTTTLCLPRYRHFHTHFTLWLPPRDSVSQAKYIAND